MDDDELLRALTADDPAPAPAAQAAQAAQAPRVAPAAPRSLITSLAAPRPNAVVTTARIPGALEKLCEVSGQLPVPTAALGLVPARLGKGTGSGWAALGVVTLKHPAKQGARGGYAALRVWDGAGVCAGSGGTVPVLLSGAVFERWYARIAVGDAVAVMGAEAKTGGDGLLVVSRDDQFSDLGRAQGIRPCGAPTRGEGAYCSVLVKERAGHCALHLQAAVAKAKAAREPKRERSAGVPALPAQRGMLVKTVGRPGAQLTKPPALNPVGSRPSAPALPPPPTGHPLVPPPQVTPGPPSPFVVMQRRSAFAPLAPRPAAASLKNQAPLRGRTSLAASLGLSGADAQRQAAPLQTRNTGLVQDAKAQRVRRRLEVLEHEDAAFTALDEVEESAATGYHCATCGRWYQYRQRSCTEQGHQVTVRQTTKRFWQCCGCGAHVALVGDLPPSATDCPRCGACTWQRATAARRPMDVQRDPEGRVVHAPVQAARSVDLTAPEPDEA